MSNTLIAAFGDPVMDAQRCFRAVLDAMARPGRLHQIGGVTPPPPLDVATAAVLLTLADNETPIWLDKAIEGCKAWLAFHCGATYVRPDRAVFAVAESLPDLDLLNSGTHESPEASTTLVLQVGSLTQGRRYRLRGPGLREPAIQPVDGLPPDFPAIWQRNRVGFPCGVDMLLCAGDRLMGLPRGITVEAA